MRLTLLIFLIFSTQIGLAQTRPNEYKFTVDLTTVVDDKVHVVLTPPEIMENEITFHLPKIIPGTYSVQDYGRFVSGFEVVDNKGNKLPFVKIDTNSWRINSAKEIARLSYWIEDSFDTQLAGPFIFWPAGTNIEDGKNFVINPGGFFGYFEGMKQMPFTFNVVRDKNFYGSTGLIAEKLGEPLSIINLEKKKKSSQKRVDVYKADDFDRLVDSPLMYANADTAVIQVANTEVLIGIYSPNNKITAKEIANNVREVLMAQKEYLGGILPVEKYAFIFYFTDRPVTSFGALEHSYSSFYYMPETSIERMKKTMQDFVSHEFFHIVTPLNIHSEEIGHFDFNNPKMSKHLWLYEGVTEYFSGNMQVKYDLITPEQYLNSIRQKLIISDRFLDNIPFTEISKKVLDEYGNQFYNVYQKGALIGLCLDIKLRKLSDGKYGLQNLISELLQKYGKDKAFSDDLLFNEIGKLTYPEIEEFMNTYVAGTSGLPLSEIFALVGVDYVKVLEEKTYSLGYGSNNITTVQYNGNAMIALQNCEEINEQGKLLGLQNEDILFKIGEKELPPLGEEASQIIAEYKASLKEGKKVSYTVLRKNVSGDYQEVILEAIVKPVVVTKRHVISFNENATPEQLELRHVWLSAQ